MAKKISKRYHCNKSTSDDTRQRLTYQDYQPFKATANFIHLPTCDLAPKTTTPHRTKMITFPRLKPLLTSIKRINFSHIFIYLLFLSSVNFGVSRRCDVDKCGNHYRSMTRKDDPAKRCRLLTLHRDCLTRMDLACRGDLLYHTSVLINEKGLKSCNISQSSSNPHNSIHRVSTRTNQCIYAGKPQYKFCSLFGDPHVRTFSDKFHTCKANGSWKLVNNDYLMVKAINSQVPGQLQATAITKLVVVIRGSGECAKKKTYRAEIGQQLPQQFVDGSTHTGINKSVNITVKDQGKEIQIDLRFIATTVVIRHVGSHLAFSIQMPGEIVDPNDRSEQMCVRGCRRHQRIPLSKEIRRLTTGPEDRVQTLTKYSEEEARIKCKDVLLRVDDESNDAFVRTRRSSGKGSKRSRQKKDVGRSASAATFNQLFDTPRDYSRSRTSSRSRKGRGRQRHHGSKRREVDSQFVQGDPGVGNRRDRSNSGVSSVTRGTNFYFEACVFDLMTTGDVTYASSARGAFDDVTRFHRSGSKAKGASKNIIVSWTREDSTSKPPTTTTSSSMVIAGKTVSAHESSTTSSANVSAASNFSILFLLLSATLYLNEFSVWETCFYACFSFGNFKWLIANR